MKIKIKIKKYLPILLLIALTACDRSHENTFQGYVEANNIFLTASFSGTLISLPFERGADVHLGDVVFQLDSNPQALELEAEKLLLKESDFDLKDQESPKRHPEIEAGKAQIEQVDARLRLAKLRQERYKLLYQKKAGNLDQADEAREYLVELEALKSQRESELDLLKLGARKNIIEEKKTRVKFLLEKIKIAKWQLAQKTGYATGDGNIFDTYYREGEWVAAGTPVVSLLLPKDIFIEFFVPASMLPKLKLNQTVYFTCAGCATKNEAVIDYIAREAEYVPPLVYSRDNYHNLVFRISAKPIKPSIFKPGQPVTITGFKHDQ